MWIASDLYVGYNPQLADVLALHGLTAVAGDVDVEWNSALTDAAATAMVDDIDFVAGTATVYHNY